MNGIEKITARIQADAKAEAGQILREGEQKAAAVKAVAAFIANMSE